MAIGADSQDQQVKNWDGVPLEGLGGGRRQPTEVVREGLKGYRDNYQKKNHK